MTGVINCLNFMNVYAYCHKKIITGFSLNWYIQMPGVRLGKKIFCILFESISQKYKLVD